MDYKDYAFGLAINNKTESRVIGYRPTYASCGTKINHLDLYFITLAWWVE